MEYTSEQLNYFRICYIAINLVPEGLRKVFKQEGCAVSVIKARYHGGFQNFSSDKFFP